MDHQRQSVQKSCAGCSGLSFIGMAIWTMIPDKIEEEETQVAKKLRGFRRNALITFFLAEMGDKTQIATVAMAAHYATPLMVVIGTTLGMLIADVPAVFVGDKLASRIPMKLVHSIAAANLWAAGSGDARWARAQGSGSKDTERTGIGREPARPMAASRKLLVYDTPLCYTD